jgi:hypothetical protein
VDWPGVSVGHDTYRKLAGRTPRRSDHGVAHDALETRTVPAPWRCGQPFRDLVCEVTCRAGVDIISPQRFVNG